jgi:hypothetical protein
MVEVIEATEDVVNDREEEEAAEDLRAKKAQALNTNNYSMKGYHLKK